MRIQYPEDHCPILKTNLGAFAIKKHFRRWHVHQCCIDHPPLKNAFNGQIELLCGDRLKFKARVLRRDDGEVAFGFSLPIGTAILMEEKKVVSIGPIA